MYRSRASEELCLHLRTIFQIAVNGCNQKGCSYRRDYGTPLRYFIRGKFRKKCQTINWEAAGQAD